jgi:uncharacterized membrane protein YbaN (DUF454 family)
MTFIREGSASGESAHPRIPAAAYAFSPYRAARRFDTFRIFMSDDLIRPKSPGNPECPAESVKAALGGNAQGPVRGLRRVVFLAVGSLSLATGVIGMFVPLLPTTCFLLLAAWCFARSSPRLHHWMFTNRVFGEYLRDNREGRGIPRALKVGSLSVMWLTIGFSVVFAISVLWVRLLLLAIAVGVTIHVAGLRDSRALATERSG